MNKQEFSGGWIIAIIIAILILGGFFIFNSDDSQTNSDSGNTEALPVGAGVEDRDVINDEDIDLQTSDDDFQTIEEALDLLE